MAHQSSTGLRNPMVAVMVAALTGAHYEINAGALPTAGGFIEIYSGEPTASADDAPTGTLLAVMSKMGDGTPLTLGGTPVGGLIRKPVGDVWRGTVLVTGIAGYYRFVNSNDSHAPSLTDPRQQGRVGEVNAELILSNVNLIAGASQDVKDFTFAVPTYG